MMTRSKDARDKYFGSDYQLTDTPDWGYCVHVAKISHGWLPLFQGHVNIKSVKDIKKLHNTGEFIIYDQYGEIYSWGEFKKKVLDFNGGVKDKIPQRNIINLSDKGEKIPISHFDYDGGKYRHMYYKDAEGFEFTNHQFS
jgi:hypothetical protein